MTHETTTIPLNKLVPWDGNVRRTGASDGIDELAASIAAHGLLQSLVVRKGKRGKYAVVAGGRRLLALQKLANDKAVAATLAVPCRIVEPDINGGELSLAENVVRMPMHPADQFEAFRDLAENGASIADVAARFGVTEALVAKRLKLGRVSPAILAAYRDGEIDLELVQAFTISDDHQAQERVLADTPTWNLRPGIVKRALTEGEVPVTDKRVRLVSLDAYEEAGGIVRRDLFDPEDGGTVLDSGLLDTLVAQKLESAAHELRGEGWKWVEIRPELDYSDLDGFARHYPERVTLSDDDQAELDTLTADYDELVDSDDEAAIERLAEIENRIDTLSAMMECWPQETLAIAGAIVAPAYRGDIRIERGLVRPEDRQAIEHGEQADSDEDAAEPAVRLSAKLITDLTARKSAAISTELAAQPDIALAVVVHALALSTFYNFAGSHSCLQISTTATGLRSVIDNPDDCAALTALEAARDRWYDQLPGNPADLWTWCLTQSLDTLQGLLAVIAALAVDAVQSKGMVPDSTELGHADALAEALFLDMATWFTPTAANFFSRINSASIQAAMAEAKGCSPAPGWAKLKKVELAAMAERQIAETGWLPEPLRIAKHTIDDDATEPMPDAAE